MKDLTLTVAANEPVLPDTWQMVLSGDCSEISRPGQFIDIKIPGRFLRRPISIFDWTEDTVTILYKVVGGGTADLSAFGPGAELDVLLPLGNGFDVLEAGEKPLLIAGGIGMPPMYGCAKALTQAGRMPGNIQVVCGFNTADQVLPMDCFERIGVTPIICTADGSVGQKGFVTDVMKDLDYDYIFACGPSPMLRAIYPLAEEGQISLEERMGCGFGACMGCSVMTKAGPRRVCADGPVFSLDELIRDEEA